jgi:hypothetical protein
MFCIHPPSANAGIRKSGAQRAFRRFYIAIPHRSHDRGARRYIDVVCATYAHASIIIEPKCEANAAESTGGTALPT